ncbi:CocE/NonD family hydrolase [Dysgonomonas termitidis]|uniref:CocE/NonD family hydrolase n=1 Tax=Dysgonomonas termitidis TaxID=1516126 RepID=A0ABV9KS87_9BACT
MIPMRDGVHLYTAVYAPVDRGEKHPFLLTRTPYSCKPYGVPFFKEALWDSYLYEYLKEEYIYVVQDVRGEWKSEGEFENVRPFIAQKQNNRDIDEASDAYDTVEWLVKIYLIIMVV